jgi:hypothetical protein
LPGISDGGPHTQQKVLDHADVSMLEAAPAFGAAARSTAGDGCGALRSRRLSNRHDRAIGRASPSHDGPRDCVAKKGRRW